MSPEEGFPKDLQTAAEWLAANWEGAVNGAPLTAQLRERYGLAFADAVKVIAAVRNRRAQR